MNKQVCKLRSRVRHEIIPSYSSTDKSAQTTTLIVHAKTQNDLPNDNQDRIHEAVNRKKNEPTQEKSYTVDELVLLNQPE